jgi:hypothetical protein
MGLATRNSASTNLHGFQSIAELAPVKKASSASKKGANQFQSLLVMVIVMLHSYVYLDLNVVQIAIAGILSAMLSNTAQAQKDVKKA